MNKFVVKKNTEKSTRQKCHTYMSLSDKFVVVSTLLFSACVLYGTIKHIVLYIFHHTHVHTRKYLLLKCVLYCLIRFVQSGRIFIPSFLLYFFSLPYFLLSACLLMREKLWTGQLLFKCRHGSWRCASFMVFHFNFECSSWTNTSHKRCLENIFFSSKRIKSERKKVLQI